jgi:hypothetical protein
MLPFPVSPSHTQSNAAAAAGGDQDAADIARLARALVSAYERGGRVYALNRIVGGSNNWRLRAKMADDSFFSNAADWSFGGPGGEKGEGWLFWWELFV